MALIYTTGFDLYGNATDLSMDGWNQSGGGGGSTFDVQVTNGRASGGCLRVQRGNGAGNNPIGGLKQFSNMGLALAHTFVGFAYNPTPPGGSGNNVVALLDSGGTQIDLRHPGDGSMTITRNGTILVSFAPGTLIGGTYHYIELDVVIGTGTNGSVKLIMDGIVLTNTTGINTQSTGNGQWNQILLGGGTQSALVDFRYDDLYVCDSSGSTPFNTNLTDVRVIGDLPTGPGTYTQMTKVGASATNWQSVDEKPTTGDTDYVSSSTPLAVDTYTFPSVPINSNTILAVIGHPNARKDDAGVRVIETHLRSTTSGFEADSPTTSTLSTSYTYYENIFLINPITGLAWTVVDVNNMEYGPKVVS